MCILNSSLLTTLYIIHITYTYIHIHIYTLYVFIHIVFTFPLCNLVSILWSRETSLFISMDVFSFWFGGFSNFDPIYQSSLFTTDISIWWLQYLFLNLSFDSLLENLLWFFFNFGVLYRIEIFVFRLRCKHFPVYSNLFHSDSPTTH